MKRKLLLSYTLILLVGITTTGGLSFGFIRNSHIRNLENTLISYAGLITESLEIEQQAERSRNLFLLTQKFADRTGVRVTLMDISGRVLADSADNSIMFAPQHQHPEFTLAMQRETQAVQRFDDNTEQMTMFLALPPQEYMGRPVIVRLSDPMEQLLQESLVFLGYISLSTALGLIVAMILALATVRSIVRPVNELTIAAKRVAAGDFSARIVVNTRDELQELGDTFNYMAQELSRTVTTIRRQNAEMDSMLSGMTDGVLAVDASGEILLSNYELERLFPQLRSESTRPPVSEVFSGVPEVPQLVHETLHEGQAITREITVEASGATRVLRIKSSLMRESERENSILGVFLLVQDTTEIRKLENMRKEFVANVSHELRTPLTLIAGFSETLRSEQQLTAKDRSTALHVIELETERLKRLINGLLSLSEIENIDTKAQWKCLDLCREANEALLLIRPLAEKKNIELHARIEHSAQVYGNPDWIRQLLVNLLENGVKYTLDGGTVELSVENGQDSVIIAVQDTGIGIPPDEQARIFERFYRVNKDRGKDATGTGLGLTIVEEITTELGGVVEVTSELGQGSRFVVRLPSVTTAC